MPDLSQYSIEELKRIARGGPPTPDLSSYSVEELKTIARGETEPAPEAPRREPFNLGRYLVEKVAEPTIEVGASLAGGMAAYLPSKLYGLAGMAAGRDPRVAEAEVHELAPEPRTELGKRAIEPVGRAFEIGLTPARKVGEVVTKAVGPEAGYVAEFLAELATFKGLHVGGRAIKARVQRPKLPPKPTARDLGEIPREAVERTRQLEIDRIWKEYEGKETGFTPRPIPVESIVEAIKARPERAEAIARRIRTPEGRQAEIRRILGDERIEPLGTEAGIGRPTRIVSDRAPALARDYPLAPRGERGLVRAGPEPEYIPEAEIVPSGLLPPPVGRGPGFEFRPRVETKRRPAWTAGKKQEPEVYERKGKVVARRPPTAQEIRVDRDRIRKAAEKRQAVIEKEMPLGKRVVDEVKQPVDAAIAADKAGRVKIAEKAAQKARANAERVKLADGPDVEKLVNEQLGRLPEEKVAAPKIKTTRHFQKYTSEQRAQRAASFRLTGKQREAAGEYFYTNKFEDIAYRTKKEAKEGAKRYLEATKPPKAPAPAKAKEPREFELAGEGFLTKEGLEAGLTPTKGFGTFDSLAKKLGEKHDATYMGQVEGVAKKGEKPIVLWSMKTPSREDVVFKTRGLNITELRVKSDLVKRERARLVPKAPKAERPKIIPGEKFEIVPGIILPNKGKVLWVSKDGKTVEYKIGSGPIQQASRSKIDHMLEEWSVRELAKKEEIKVTGPAKAKEVKVDIPKKEAEALKPKEQKKYLLAEIDKAIKRAPEVEDAKFDAKITIHVPGDGDFTVLNDKVTLQEFKKRARSFPATALPSKGVRKPSMPPLKARIKAGGVGEYYNVFKPRKQALIESKTRQHWTKEGWFTEGNYAVKLPSKPKTKHPLISGEEAVAIDRVMPQGTRIPARILGETDWEFEGPIAHIVGKDGTELFAPANQVDAILTQHPKAEPFIINAKQPVVFEKAGKPVGLVAPIKGLTELPESLYGRAKELFPKEEISKAEAKPEPPTVTLETLGMQTAYEKIAGAIKKRKAEKPMSREQANKLKKTVHVTARNVWGKQFTNEYETFKEQMFGRKVSARDLSPQELRQLDAGLSELQAILGTHVKGSKTKIVKERIVRGAPKKRLPVKGLVVGQEYESSSGLKWTVLSKDKEGVVVQNAKGTKKKWPIDRTLTLAEKVGKDLKAPAISEYESNGIRQGPELRTRWPLGGWTENPPRVYEELGRFWKEELYDKMRDAEVSAKKEHVKLRLDLKQAKKGLGFKSQRRIGAYAVAQQKNGKNILKAMGIKEIPELTAKEMKAYGWMRENLESLYTRLNEARRMAGKEPFGKVDDYFTFMRVFSLQERLGWTPHEPKAAKYFAEKYEQFIEKHFKTTPFRFAKQRKAARREVRLDAFNVFDAYAQSALAHIHKSPHIGRGREYLLKFPDGFELKEVKPNTAAFVSQWLDAAAGQRIRWLPRPIETGLGKLNNNLTYAVLSANIRSALIQPTAWLNTLTEIGPRYASEGISGIFKPAIRRQIMAKSALITRQYDIAVREAMEGLTGKIGAAKKVVAGTALKPLGILDMETAMASWWGAYQKALKADKLSESKARVYADDVVTKTQASALEIDLAPIQRTAVGRTMSLFQTFVINNWNFLVRDVAGIKNPRVSKAQAIKKAATWVAGATLINMFYEDVLQIPSPLPTPIRAFIDAYEKGKSIPEASFRVAIETAELVPVVGGGIRYGSSPFGAVTQLGIDTVTKVSDRPGPKKSYVDIAGKWLGVPGTAQYEKTRKRLKWGYTVPEALLGAGKGKRTSVSRERRSGRPRRPRRAR